MDIRSGRLDDLDVIAPWTKDTFAWGDYIAQRFEDWVSGPGSRVLVCVDDRDAPIAMVHAAMLSAHEGWLEGARVRPDYKRSGLGSTLNHEAVAWLKSEGARVVRLAIEEDNQAARSQVAKLGYREGSVWTTGWGEPDPVSRLEDTGSMRPANPADVEPAWMFWSTSDLASAGRGLLNQGWQWRSATDDDLRRGLSRQALVQSRAGWALLRETGTDVMQTMWLASAPEDFPSLLDGLLNLTAEGGLKELEVRAPALDWVTESFRRARFRTSRIVICYRAA